jgi:hypothetical protein
MRRPGIWRLRMSHLWPPTRRLQSPAAAFVPSSRPHTACRGHARRDCRGCGDADRELPARHDRVDRIHHHLAARRGLRRAAARLRKSATRQPDRDDRLGTRRGRAARYTRRADRDSDGCRDPDNSQRLVVAPAWEADPGGACPLTTGRGPPSATPRQEDGRHRATTSRMGRRGQPPPLSTAPEAIYSTSGTGRLSVDSAALAQEQKQSGRSWLGEKR